MPIKLLGLVVLSNVFILAQCKSTDSQDSNVQEGASQLLINVESQAVKVTGKALEGLSYRQEGGKEEATSNLSKCAMYRGNDVNVLQKYLKLSPKMMEVLQSDLDNVEFSLLLTGPSDAKPAFDVFESFTARIPVREFDQFVKTKLYSLSKTNEEGMIYSINATIKSPKSVVFVSNNNIPWRSDHIVEPSRKLSMTLQIDYKNKIVDFDSLVKGAIAKITYKETKSVKKTLGGWTTPQTSATATCEF